MNTEQRLWLDHTTGKQPVSDGTIVEVILKDGAKDTGTEAQYFRWDALNIHDIEKYRVLPAADGWIENAGVQPVADGVLIDTKWASMAPEFAHEGDTFVWTIGFGITHWRFHQEEKPEPAPLQPPRVMRLSEQVAVMEDNAAVLKEVIQGLENENADLKSKLEAIRGLV